jgi:hypothetical protein
VVHETAACVSPDDSPHMQRVVRRPDRALFQGGTRRRCNVCEAHYGRHVQGDRPRTMGIFLTDEGRWKQAGAVITFNPKDPKNSSYQATENEHNGKTFLAITSLTLPQGSSLPPMTLRKTSMPTLPICPTMCCSRSVQRPTKLRRKQTYPFRYIRPQR